MTVFKNETLKKLNEKNVHTNQNEKIKFDQSWKFDFIP